MSLPVEFMGKRAEAKGGAAAFVKGLSTGQVQRPGTLRLFGV